MPAKHHVMKMPDNKIGIVDMDVEGQRPLHQAGQTTDTKQEDESERMHVGGGLRMDPLWSVACQLKTFDRTQTATMKVSSEKTKLAAVSDMPLVNM